MDIIISNSSGKPIYEQIVLQIKEGIITGRLRPGEALPSMRNLAMQLRISIITTKRAYEELEKEGFIESFTGKGSFVKAQDPELLREEGLRQTESLLVQAVEKAKQSGISQEELANAMEVSRQTIISLEKGKYNPSIILAFKLARYFGLRIEEIFIYDESNEK